MRLKSLLLFLTIGFYSSVLAQTSISELKTPNKSTIDFTFNSVDKTSPTFSNGTIVDKVSYELNSLQKLFPRLFKVSSCQKDSYNTLYCPDALVKADEYWGYDQSEVISKKQTVIDFEQGTYQELTSTVRDFMDGFANTHNSTVTDYQTGSGTSNVGTVIDYQNGYSVSGIGQVVDYTNKVTTTTTTTKLKFQHSLTIGGYYWNAEGSPANIPLLQNSTYYNSGSNGNYLCCVETTRSSSDIIQLDRGGNAYHSTYYPNNPLSDTISETYSLGLSEITVNGYISGDTAYMTIVINNIGRISSTETYTNTATQNQALWFAFPSKYDFYPYGEYYSIVPVTEYTTTLTCPTGYTETAGAEASKGQCKKTVSYNFYQYTCPSTYTPINYGFTSFTKTDPNTTTENWNTLDDDVNSSTSPTGNCKKTITYSYYKYNCPSGYTVNDGGLYSACPKTDPNKTINNESTLSQPCNNSTPPTGNCEKIIPYTFYSYECSSGYTAIDKGLATCTKTDSSTSTNTSSTLSQPCNSATPPKENCYKDISYKHYTYGCSPGYITDNYGLSNVGLYI